MSSLRFSAYATAATRTIASIIHATPIRKDQEGRYCLNDLHKAAGGQDKHQPAFFMRMESTTALAEAISNSADSQIKPVEASRGRYGGTYVHEDLAIDYAAWISHQRRGSQPPTPLPNPQEPSATPSRQLVPSGGLAGAGADMCARAGFDGQGV